MRLWQTGHRKRASECSGLIKFHFLIIFFFARANEANETRDVAYHFCCSHHPGTDSVNLWPSGNCVESSLCVCLHLKQPESAESQILWLNLFGIQKVYRIFGNIMGNQIEWNFIVQNIKFTREFSCITWYDATVNTLTFIKKKLKWGISGFTSQSGNGPI